MRCNWSHTVGSISFFKDREGFVPHDSDVLQLMRDWDTSSRSMYCKIDGTDYFLYPDIDGKQLIAECTDPLTIGKFLVPEVAERIGITASDLLPLKPLAEQLKDGKHSYVYVLFESAIQRNDIQPDKETLDKAWQEYCKWRNIK